MLKKHRSAEAWRATSFALILCALLILGCDRKVAPMSPPASPLPSLPPLSQVQFANDRILKALSESTEMDFVETPLKDFAESLQIRHGIKIELDAEPMAAIGVTADTPLTYKAKGLSLNSALGQILPQLKLSYVIDNGRMLITTAEKAKSR
jgi:hypothetical protein